MAECQTCGCKLGRTVKTPIDRSLGFTAMLELYPGFRQMPDTEGMGITTAFLEDWYGSDHTDMWAYAREWVGQRTRTPCGDCGGGYWQEYIGPPATDQLIPHAPECRTLEDHEIDEHTSPPEPGTPGHEPVYGPNADGNPYAQFTPEHRVWEKARQNGKAAAQWVFDGNTTQATFRQALGWIRDGDPQMETLEPSSLRGDYTDDDLLADAGWVPHDGTDLREQLIAQYDQDAVAAFWHEVEATALRQFNHETASNITQLGNRFIECTCGERFSGGIDPQRIAERNFAHHLKTAREA